MYNYLCVFMCIIAYKNPKIVSVMVFHTNC